VIYIYICIYIYIHTYIERERERERDRERESTLRGGPPMCESRPPTATQSAGMLAL